MESKISNYLNEKGIKLYSVKESQQHLIFSIDIWAKPGSKKEKIQIGESGEVIVAVSARAIDGQANKAIIRYLAKSIGLSQSQIHLSSGTKSKLKRFEISFSFTEHKTVGYYLDKLTKTFT